MQHNLFRILISLIILFFIASLAACEFDTSRLSDLNPLGPKGTPQEIIDTQIASTLQAEQTRVAPTPTYTPRPTREQRTATPTATFVITPTASLTPTLLPTSVLADDFSSYSGWAIGQTDTYAFGFDKGGYFIFVDFPGAPIWSARSIDLANVSLEVDAIRLAGPENGYFGLMCRQQQDGYNYYIMVISSDGSYGIGKVINGTLNFLREDKDQTGIILPGENPNHLRADCVNQTLILYINHQKILEVQDESYKNGSIGLVAGNRTGKGLNILFDNFVILEP